MSEAKEATVTNNFEIGLFGNEMVNHLMTARMQSPDETFDQTISLCVMDAVNDVCGSDPEAVTAFVKEHESEMREDVESNYQSYVDNGLSGTDMAAVALGVAATKYVYQYLPNILCVVALRMATEMGYSEVPLDALFAVHTYASVWLVRTINTPTDLTIDVVRDDFREIIETHDTDIADEKDIAKMA